MYFELFSDGSLVPLPRTTSLPPGLPADVKPEIVLFAPFNRVLMGYVTLSGYERWLWGKLFSKNWEEKQLYTGHSLQLSLPWKNVFLKGEQVIFLQRMMRKKISPPGSHDKALSMLKRTQRESPGFALLEALNDPVSLWEYILRTPCLRAAYWGFRMANLWGGDAMRERIELWLHTACPLYDSGLERPRLWGFLSDFPDGEFFQQMQRLGFQSEKIRGARDISKDFFVIKSPSGYLMQHFYPLRSGAAAEDHILFYLYLTKRLWHQAKEERELLFREIFFSSWGFLDALEAEVRFAAYDEEHLEKQHEMFPLNGHVSVDS